MKILVILTLLVLDYSALDDITTGNEPDYTLEYAILALSAVIFLHWYNRVNKI
ncbi:MAG: hypothetical protein ACD_30C00039G0010 [uncultured bacterium]|uniref:Uncharacterized protein n=2 Tax=Candidatus Daviesiibacteriota TaxID=1752718 RepID=A0A0G0ENG0_9BACT|nr:MAG: hypothetical protein ACD_30C00039G0010 [uncultured bacterium]KKQ08553.1 MAG: hypothetical protein US19_C0022G0014 [Candidatus Daviesbacteria bacterium GW2011_GWB1_36_5]KKQ13910.1 MAG: hypothetical protein US28_C0042G0009 [Candidatus Daviesbacteria bacterium GW2011_GWA1_36_8]